MLLVIEIGLSGYNVKPRFGAFQYEYLLQNSLFLGTRHLCESNIPTLDRLGGVGVCTVSPAGS